MRKAVYVFYIILLVSITAFAAITLKSKATTVKVNPAPIPGTSKLAIEAAKLQPGQWVVLNKSGDGSNYGYDLLKACSPQGCNDNILNYADKGFWLPLTGEMRFLGKGHYAETKYIGYEEDTNKWSQLSQPSWACGPTVNNCSGMGHGFEHSAANPNNGDFYGRIQSSGVIYKHSANTNTWAQIPTGPELQIAAAIEYFPEMNGLLFIGCTMNSGTTGQAHFFNGTSWKALSTNLPMGDYHNMARYNPVHKILVFGGGNGSNKFYKIDATGTISAIANAPFAVRIRDSVLTVDPASGNYLLFGPGGEFYEYITTQNTWRNIGGSGVPIFRRGDSESQAKWIVAIPITTYKVNAFLTEQGQQVYLYKHAN